MSFIKFLRGLTQLYDDDGVHNRVKYSDYL